MWVSSFRIRWRMRCFAQSVGWSIASHVSHHAGEHHRIPTISGQNLSRGPQCAENSVIKFASQMGRSLFVNEHLRRYVTGTDMTHHDALVYLRPYHLAFHSDHGFKGYIDPAWGLAMIKQLLQTSFCAISRQQRHWISLACQDTLISILELMVCNGSWLQTTCNHIMMVFRVSVKFIC